MKVTIEEDPDLQDIEIRIATPRMDANATALIALLSAFDKKVHGTDDAGSIHIVDAREVLYFELVEGDVFAYLPDSVLQTSLKLDDAEQALGPTGFTRASRSFVVNLARVERITPSAGARLILTLSNGEDVIASRKYAKAIKQRLGIDR